MGNRFYISDLHFRHHQIIDFSPERGVFSCVEEHDEFLIDQWNARVTKRDTVIVMGDVLFGSPGKHMADTVGRLKGTLRLVPGNHDHKKIKRLATYFDILPGAVPHTLTLRDGTKLDCVLTHVPVHPQNLDRWRFNIHGHMHHNFIKFQDTLGQWRIDKRYYNACPEHIGMAPKPVSELCDELAQRITEVPL